MLAAFAAMYLMLLAGNVWAMKGELGAKEAQRLIRRMAGINLPSDAVRVKAVSPSGAMEWVALAQIETAFRFERGDDQRWRIAEIRTGSDLWEDLSLMARALGGEEAGASAVETRMTETTPITGAPDAGRARGMIARLVGVELPSDAVRVREISALYKSAVVVARVEAEFRFNRGADKKWRVAQIRTIGGEWTDVDAMVRAVNDEKARRARMELELLAAALDSFRRERGFYVVANNAGVLLDQLNPRYLARVIRLDPWRRPYLYEGERDRYVLRSAGADGEPGTADDINAAGRAQALENTVR
ncbi:MAG TPA: type II secretion system protein GspG [Pyrinomonadaceae bacterium]|jgi:hypothetical protein|nr:type II secretion system protein GspG [Pyrinomonadaceae bacterium]